MEEDKKYCKVCGVELNESNFFKELQEQNINICYHCYMQELWKNGELEYCDKWLSRHLDILEKLGFNKEYILTHFFNCGNTYEKEHGNYYIWTYKAEQGPLKGAVLELWFHSKTWRKTASLYVSGDTYWKISFKRLEEVLNKFANME